MTTREALQITVSQEKVRHLLQEHEEGLLIEDPEWQRHAGIWSAQGKSRLIESAILGLPIPPLFLLSHGRKRELVDGLQRFTVFKSFLSNEFKLVGLEFLNTPGVECLENLRCKQLPQEMQDALHHVVLSTYTVPSSTTWGREVARIMFRRLNSGKSVTRPEMLVGSYNIEIALEVAAYIMEKLWAGARYKNRRQNRVKRMEHVEDALIVLMALRTKLEADDFMLTSGHAYKSGGNDPWAVMLETNTSEIEKMTPIERSDLRSRAHDLVDLVGEVFPEPFAKYDSEKGEFSPRTHKQVTFLQVWGFAQSDKPLSYWPSRGSAVNAAFKALCDGDGEFTTDRQLFVEKLQSWADRLAAI